MSSLYFLSTVNYIWSTEMTRNLSVILPVSCLNRLRFSLQILNVNIFQQNCSLYRKIIIVLLIHYTTGRRNSPVTFPKKLEEIVLKTFNINKWYMFKGLYISLIYKSYTIHSYSNLIWHPIDISMIMVYAQIQTLNIRCLPVFINAGA